MNFKSISDALQNYRPTWRIREIKESELVDKARLMACRGYKHTPKTIEILQYYLQGYSILISGNVGTGKSFFFKTLEREMPTLNMNEAFLWEFKELRSWLMGCSRSDILIDDVGGDGKANDYGRRYDALMIALEYRLASGGRTHFTTNLNNDQLIANYDYRIVDRIYEIAKPFSMDRTESLREATPDMKYVVRNNKPQPQKENK